MDDFTFGLLSNDEVLAVDQDPLGKQATRVKEDLKAGIEVWRRPLADGTIAVGLFNRGRHEIEPPPRPKKGEAAPKQVWKLRDRATGKATDFDNENDAEAELKKTDDAVEISVDWAELHLSGPQPVRDLWRQKDLGPADGKVSAKVCSHGAVMLKIGMGREFTGAELGSQYVRTRFKRGRASATCSYQETDAARGSPPNRPKIWPHASEPSSPQTAMQETPPPFSRNVSVSSKTSGKSWSGN